MKQTMNETKPSGWQRRTILFLTSQCITLFLSLIHILQRYKGLGEMDAEQLWETTLDPERRVLKRVEIEDARLASEVTEMLMGSEVGPRRQFIYEHADEAEIDA